MLIHAGPFCGKTYLQKLMWLEGICLVDMDDIRATIYKEYGSSNVWVKMTRSEKDAHLAMALSLSEHHDILTNVWSDQWPAHVYAYSFYKEKPDMLAEFKKRGDKHDWLTDVVDTFKYPTCATKLKFGEYISQNLELVATIKYNAVVRGFDAPVILNQTKFNDPLDKYKHLASQLRQTRLRQSRIIDKVRCQKPNIDALDVLIDLRALDYSILNSMLRLFVAMSDPQRHSILLWEEENGYHFPSFTYEEDDV